MANVRRDGWVLRGGTDDGGWGVHLSFVLASVLAAPALCALIVVAVRTSGLARFGAVLAAVALGLLLMWTAALFAFVLGLAANSALGRKHCVALAWPCRRARAASKCADRQRGWRTRGPASGLP